jgi:hypothetical protein
VLQRATGTSPVKNTLMSTAMSTGSSEERGCNKEKTNKKYLANMKVSDVS